ncbi:kumamolisin [Cryobacterium mesophilum]|uniref:Peptidase S53 n=1 Tax=Terrimesophilobacter mesophilus TaxID=433647 RepID=A0A4R8V959_9MICO|nr:S53 family peptidase [Terrimesophilobacter mesophilus]MBB5632442.1 kumamolisin [Terrimesophilobacter mesophilus]TFB79273.1 peptidase S53 [Terrimesophilobacter mesophilus]
MTEPNGDAGSGSPGQGREAPKQATPRQATPRPPDSEPLELVPLPGSERPPAEGARPAAVPLDPGGTVMVTLVVRRKSAAVAPDPLAPHSTPADAAAAHGADPTDIALVVDTMTRVGLTVLDTDIASRRVHVSGATARVCEAFGTTLASVTSIAPAGAAAERCEHRHRTGGLSIPKELDGIVTAVLGLDDRPQARAQFRIAFPHAVSVSYTPPQLGEIYRFPADTDGTGQTIAIIELGGGYGPSDLDAYFNGLELPTPSVTAVGVDGAANAPGTGQDGADGEVLLDIEVAGALCPAASFVVYFAPNTDAGFLDAIADAAHAIPTPTAMSISWGQSEDQWTAQARGAMDDALLDAVALGVTVTAAAGDNGSSNGSRDGSDHADFPASSPHALACGGTTLQATAAAVISEVVWNDGPGGGATGGGVSDVFGMPAWQSGVGIPGAGRQGARVAAPGRGVPDVAGNADPNTGYQVLVHGVRAVYGGTSAVAPLWAALVARFAQSLGTPLGLLQPKLYGMSTGFRDITVGDNGSYSAGQGWDACTGLGTPDGTAILAGLAAAVE